MRKFALAILVLLLAACQTFNQPFGVSVEEKNTPGAATPAHPQATATRQPALTLTPTLTPTPTWLMPAAALQGVNIQFWHPWTGQSAAEAADLVKTFNRQNEWKITVELTAYGGAGALDDAVQDALAAGSLPQVLAAAPEQAASWGEGAQRLVDLSAYMAHPDWQLRAGYYPALWSTQAGTPQFSIPAEMSAQVLYYNQGWARELGFNTPPATPDEFREQACAAFNDLLYDKIPENNGLGGWIVSEDAGTALSWMYAFGAPVISSAGAGLPFNTAENAAALTFVRGMQDEGCAWRSRLAQPYEYFANRQALFYSGRLEDAAMQAQTQVRLKRQDQWALLPFPSLDGQGVLLTGGLSYAIPQSTPAQQLAAWVFVRWMLEPEQQARLAQTSGTLTLSPRALQQMAGYANSHPQWAELQARVEAGTGVYTEPRDAAWSVVRHMLEDAAWQALQPNVLPEQIPGILEMLDGMIPEITQP